MRASPLGREIQSGKRPFPLTKGDGYKKTHMYNISSPYSQKLENEHPFPVALLNDTQWHLPPVRYEDFQAKC